MHDYTSYPQGKSQTCATRPGLLETTCWVLIKLLAGKEGLNF